MHTPQLCPVFGGTSSRGVCYVGSPSSPTGSTWHGLQQVPSFQVSPTGVFLYLPKDLSCVLISVSVKIQTEAIDLWRCPPRSPTRTSNGPREQGGDPRARRPVGRSGFSVCSASWPCLPGPVRVTCFSPFLGAEAWSLCRALSPGPERICHKPPHLLHCIWEDEWFLPLVPWIKLFGVWLLQQK